MLTGLSSIETTAVSAAKGASHGIDGMTASMAKGVVAGNLLAEAIKSAVETEAPMTSRIRWRGGSSQERRAR